MWAPIPILEVFLGKFWFWVLADWLVGGLVGLGYFSDG